MPLRLYNKLTSIYSRFRLRFARGGTDIHAASVRILLALGVVIYLLIKQYYEASLPPEQESIVFMAVVYLTYAVLQWLSNLIWPGPNVIRRAISILADTGIVTYALLTAGETATPFFGGYLWVTIANGLRFGRKYLLVTNFFGVVGFSLVLLLSPYWRTQIILGVGLMVWLILLPGYVTVLLKRLEDALHRANLANKAKSDFLSNMSHELRTPLNVIIGYSDMLQEDAVADANGQVAEDLEKIRLSANHLLGLINGILDLSKIESGGIELSSECFDIRVFFEDILAGMRPMFERRANVCAIKFMLTQYQFCTDKLKLKQIIINLLDNANKFTRSGQIQVEVQDLGDDNNSMLKIQIRDSGIGISKDKLATIFDPFTQADTSSTRQYEGVGLGLTITRRFVEILGGNISVASQDGKGSVFSVCLPQRRFLCPVASQEDVCEPEPRRKLAG